MFNIIIITIYLLKDQRNKFLKYYLFMNLIENIYIFM